MSDLVDKSLGRYRLLEKIGEGGMAVVYKAIDTRLQRTLAVKIILPAYVYTANFRQRFEVEARALAQLYHDNIVLILDFGEQDGVPYLVTPFIDGGNLKSRLGSRMPYWEAARLLAPIARALEYTHKHHIIHRDIKPANILLTADDKPMLSDFGIAKIIQAEETLGLTGTGMMVGTPDYMAPEQATGSIIDERVDIYALGGVFYEMITGRVPYQADTPFGVIIKKMNDPLPGPENFVPGLPKAVTQALEKALAKEPGQRYPDMAAFAAELERLSAPPLPEPKPKRKPIGIPFIASGLGLAILAIAIAAGALIFYLGNKTNSPVAGIQTETTLTSTLPTAGDGRSPDRTVLPAVPLAATQTLWPVPSRTAAVTATAAHIALPTLPAASTRTVTLTVAASATATRAASRTLTSVPTSTVTMTGTATATATRAAPRTLTPTPSQAPAATATNGTPETGLAAGTVRTSSKDGMKMVFVPAGDYIKNISTGENLPGRVGTRYIQQTVSVKAFWIDILEVTNGMYRQCVQAGRCYLPKKTGSHIRPKYYDEEKYANYPVIYMDYGDAYKYCEWAGKRLPGRNEWEKAASGTDGRQFPWGETPASPGLLNFYSSQRNDTTEVGSYPAGASPYGALDMAGNVFEWIAEGGIKGGAFNYAERGTLIGSNGGRLQGDTSGDNLGIRCAADTVP